MRFSPRCDSDDHFSLPGFLERYRTAIIEEWIIRLHTECGSQYSHRPLCELRQTISEAFDADVDVLVYDNFTPMDRFIDKITRLRLEAGFLLSDVQKAFELFRCIVIPLLILNCPAAHLGDTIQRINRCLAYTIHRFSDHFQDMHQKKIIERRIRENERMATIGQITTSLSHEIRNPLSAVKLNLQVLKKNPLLQGNDRRRITISVEEVMRLEQILNQLLNFAKPVQLEQGLYSVNAVVADFAEVLEVKFKEKTLTLILDFQDDLAQVSLDKEKFGQALINILLNAIDASPPDASIAVRTRRVDTGPGQIQIVIEDEGCGLPDPGAGNIFTPFFTTKSKGTGLGLTNAQRIVEAHGGWITAENRAPAGAKFTLCLPLGENHGQSAHH
jgi:signal transduction histidine kinase